MKPVLLKVFICTIALSLMSVSTAWAKDTKSLPEVSEDGLHLLKGTEARIVYAKPGATLEPYSKVMLVDCFVAFRDSYKRDYNLDQLGLSGQITDKDIEKIKDSLADEFEKKFTEVLTKDGHAVVDEAGPDVLLVRPAIINLDITAPDVRSSFTRTIVQSAGQMTLYMELYDSVSHEILARVVDPQADNKAFAEAALSHSEGTTRPRTVMLRWRSLMLMDPSQGSPKHSLCQLLWGNEDAYGINRFNQGRTQSEVQVGHSVGTDGSVHSRFRNS